MKSKFIRIFNLILAFSLSLFGFSNCDDVRVEYGVPNADYAVKGKVIDKSNLKPIKGIRVGFSPYPNIMVMYGVMPTPYQSTKADTTDISGNYELTDNIFPTEELTVYVQDIDGSENGLYNDTTLNIDMNNAIKSGKTSNWYDGKYTLEQDIKLRPKTNE